MAFFGMDCAPITVGFDTANNQVTLTGSNLSSTAGGTITFDRNVGLILCTLVAPSGSYAFSTSPVSWVSPTTAQPSYVGVTSTANQIVIADLDYSGNVNDNVSFQIQITDTSTSTTYSSGTITVTNGALSSGFSN
jgi:hypothetical protein